MQKLVKLGRILDGKATVSENKQIAQAIKLYQDLSKEKTTDATRRKERQQQFIQALSLLPEGANEHGNIDEPISSPATEGTEPV